MLLQILFPPIVSSYVYFFAQALATMQWDWSKKWPDLNIDVDQCIFLKVGNKELWCWQNCKENLWKKNFFSPLLFPYQLFWFIWYQCILHKKVDKVLVELLHCSVFKMSNISFYLVKFEVWIHTILECMKKIRMALAILCVI